MIHIIYLLLKSIYKSKRKRLSSLYTLPCSCDNYQRVLELKKLALKKT